MKTEQRRSILCPKCRKLISGDVKRCPYCNTTNPGSWWKNLLWHREPGGENVIRIIIYVNVGMFILSLLLNPKRAGLSFNPLHFLSPDNNSLFLLGATGSIPIYRLHRWWTLVSANYLHGGILHIAFNMIAFYQLAPLVIQKYGVYRMFALYSLSGIVGYWISSLAGVFFTIGASAAICGLMGALLYFGKSRGGHYGRAVYSQIGGWAVALLLFGFIVPGINNWGHVGGMAAGGLLGFLLGYNEIKRETFFHMILAGACAVFTAAILFWAVASTFLGNIAI